MTTTHPQAAAQECLSEDALAQLKKYKYSSVDKSLITHYVLRHYWNGAVKLLPPWIAPNLVTLIGFFFIVVNIGILMVQVPDLVGPAPPWVYYSFAFGFWIHGIDSLNCTLASLFETAAMGLGHTPKGAFTALVPCLPMFFSTWETYHTHTLYLGYFNGPTEGIIGACMFMTTAGLYGPQIWYKPLAAWFGLSRVLGDYSVIDLWVPFVLGTFLVAHLPSCILNVVQARRRQGLPVGPVFLEWTPMIAFLVGCGGWLYSPHSHLLEGQHLVLFCLTMSCVFGRMTTKIILAHLTRQPFPFWTVMLVPLLVGAALVNAPFFGLSVFTHETEVLFLQGYFAFAVVVYVRWAVLVISTICRYLQINCLTITPKPDKLQANGTAHEKSS